MTQSHQVFIEWPLCLVPSSSIVIPIGIILRLNMSKPPYFITKLTGSSLNNSPISGFLFLSFTKTTRPSKPIVASLLYFIWQNAFYLKVKMAVFCQFSGLSFWMFRLSTTLLEHDIRYIICNKLLFFRILSSVDEMVCVKVHFVICTCDKLIASHSTGATSNFETTLAKMAAHLRRQLLCTE